MAAVIVGGLQKAQEAVRQATSNEKKAVDLERDTVNIHTNQPLTTDHGVRVENADQWLRVVEDQHTGFDPVSFTGMRAVIKAAGALPVIIETKRSRIYAEGESPSPSAGRGGFSPGHQLDGNGQIKHWIAETFGHMKALGATAVAVTLVKESLGAVSGLKVGSAEQRVELYEVVTAGGVQKPESFRETVNIVRGATDFADLSFYQIAQHRNYQRELDGLVSSVAF
ncbi:catalase A [Penicillium lagena]|uniref:catalase A n=1 Tax=Penicillium lagena TaxID=94218 RepID=UPI0025424E64|nr:catalase A [Penicillium lagena]KAJ5612742.1 catalase A [Penicillium lagena]